MSDFQFIQSIVHRTARRRRGQRAFRGLWNGLFAGSLVWLGALVIYKCLPVPPVILAWGAGVAGLCVCGGALIAGRSAPAPAAAARWLDQRLQLRERLSTALELAPSASSPEWRRIVLRDAVQHARELDVRRLLPFTLPRISRWVLLPLALAAGLGFVPEYRTAAYRQAQADAAVIQETGRQLTELIRRTRADHQPVTPAVEQALERVQDLGELLQRAKLTRSEALRELARVTEPLKDLTQDLAKDPALRRLEQASRQPGATPPIASTDQQQALDALQKTLGDQAPAPENLDKLQQALQQLQQTAVAMPAGDSAMKPQLEQLLADIAPHAAELGLSLPALDEARQALAADQIDRFLKDLDLARLDLAKLAQAADALRQLPLHLAQLGKDLAERLEKGQMFAAQATLREMMRQLQHAQLPPEQLQAILREVAQAVQSGGEYGQMGEFLQDAVRQMQQGNQPAAGASLAQAADELQRLMDQLGDCQSLQAMLADLDRAAACIGTGQRWGQKEGRGLAPLPGTGGSYAGLTPAALDIVPREAVLSDALKPTQVKGQFTPDAPLPSVTLKGVNIKGVSRVQYEEAVTAAQTDAQSALNQDRVPRAYQRTVKDYFDDLQK